MTAPRIALVGFGSIAVHHIEALRHLGAEIVAACNRTQAKRFRAQEEAGIPAVYADAQGMLEDVRPDGVVVCASVLSLFDVASELIPLGIPMLLEKPPGTSVAQVDVLADLARRHDTRVMVGLNRRFYSVYSQTVEVLGGRESVTSVRVEWSEDPSRMLDVGHPAEVLPLLNYANSLHGIDLLTYFGGRSEPIYVSGRNLDPTGDGLRWQMDWCGVGEWGASTHFSSTWDAPGRWRLVVDAPGIRIVSAPLETCHVFERGKPAREIAASPEDQSFKPGFVGQARYFLDVIREGSPIEWPACSLEEAAESMRIAERLTTACMRGQR